jgi:hypothetical protein
MLMHHGNTPSINQIGAGSRIAFAKSMSPAAMGL